MTTKAKLSSPGGDRGWRFFLFVAGLVLFMSRLHADDYNPFYSLANGSEVSASFIITASTNSAGLSNWNTVYVTFNWSITARTSEGFRGGFISLPGTGGASCGNVGSGSSWTGSLSLTDTSAYQGKTYTATLSGLNGWDSGQPDWATTATSRTSQGVAGGGNQQGTASFSFSGGPWTYDGTSHAIGITPSPVNAGWQWSGGNSAGTETNSGSYNMTVTPANSDYSGSGSYSWTINKASMVAPTSAPANATPGVNWSPPTWNVNTPAPAGGGYVWTVSGRTNWGDTGWTPGIGDAGTSQTFYLAVYGPAANYNGVTDSHLPGSVLSISSGYGVAVSKANQTISFGNPGSQTYGSAFGVSGNASSGLSVTFSIVSGPASVSGTTVTPTGTGSVTIRASQGGNSQYNAAADVDQTITVNKANQGDVTVAATPTTITTAQSSALSASGGSGTGAYVYQVGSGPGSISGSTMNPTGTGTVNVQAMRQGDSNYNGSSWSSSVGITVNPAFISTGFTIGNTNQIYDGTQKAVIVTPNPSDASYSVTYNGSSTPPTNAGSYTVSVNGTGNYSGSASATLTINKANQGVAVSISPTSPTTSTGNSITFTASGGSGSGPYTWGGVGSGTGGLDTVTFNIAGTRNVTVFRAGDSNYNASNTATATITVNTSTTFSFSPTTFTFDGASHGPTTTPSPAGATYTVTGTSSAVTAGSYSFTATATGSYSGSVVCNWSILTPGSLSYSGTSNFGSAYRDAQAGSPTSTTQSFTLTNTGQTSLTINSIVMAGNYTIASGPTLPLTLAGGNSTPLAIRFTPGSSTGTNNGSCTINTTANSPSFNLTGTGLAPKINVNWH